MQSLISRSEELVLSLQVIKNNIYVIIKKIIYFLFCQVINELRIEITYVLKDITDAKRNCKEVCIEK